MQRKRASIYQLRDRFGEEVVVAAIRAGGRSTAPEMEVGQNLPIGQGSQQQLLREFFIVNDRFEGNIGIKQ